MLPIKRIVLFKHGVGFFQRIGKVNGDEQVELSFKSGQMNDVLKSLTALDFDGGSFSAASYDAEESMERRLGELNMSIPEKGAISAFLDRIKGAQVSLPKDNSELVGAVMGIEEVEKFHNGAKIKDLHLAILTKEGALVRTPLLEINTITFLDASIQRDLNTLLDILFSGLRKDLKRLRLQAQGAGERNVSVSYVIEAPVWKTSYRFMLSEDEGDKPLIQGWALVDNTTEDDWEGVSLSLMAGLPISFIHDLYTPRYRHRPVVKVEEEAIVAPPIVEAGEMLDDMMEECEMAPPCPAEAPMPMKRAKSAPPAPMAMGQAAKESTQVHTRTQEVGDLFAYEITKPVDIGRSQSALVPILQAEAEMERVALYNEGIREKNPMTAFRIKNDTNLTLEGGPVTVYEGSCYVGEAMLDTLRKDEERITPYSVELGVTVKKEVHTQHESFSRATKSGQYIYKHYQRILVTSYAFNSRLDREIPLYLDHPFQYNLPENAEEPVEITDNFWRFRFPLAIKKTTPFVVKEVSEEYECVEIPSMARAEIHNLVDAKLISGRAKKELERIATQAEIIQKLRVEVNKLENEERKIEKGQARLRENLKALGDTTEEAALRRKYVNSLSKEEERIETIREQLTNFRERIEQEEKVLNGMIDDLEL